MALTRARVMGVLEVLARRPAHLQPAAGPRCSLVAFSRPGKPMDNPFIERFNGRLRDEHLNVELFFSVADAVHPGRRRRNPQLQTV